MTEREGLVNRLKQKMLSDDWDSVCEASGELGEIDGDDVIDFLIPLLERDHSGYGIRERAALALRDTGDDRALAPLLNSIFKKENQGQNGTMVYALQTMDCSNHIRKIFDLLFHGNYEAYCGVLMILDEQEFIYSNEDISEIKAMWGDCLKSPEECPDFDEELKRREIKTLLDKFTKLS